MLEHDGLLLALFDELDHLDPIVHRRGDGDDAYFLQRVDRECRERMEGGGELVRGDGAAEEVVGGAWDPPP